MQWSEKTETRRYSLKNEPLIVLLFIQDGRLVTTVRPLLGDPRLPPKLGYYRDMRGKPFMFEFGVTA